MLRMLKPIRDLMVHQFSESLRSRWLLAYALSYLLLGLSLTQFSLIGVSYLGLHAVGRVTASLINLSLYLIPLISLIMGSISIVGERESGLLEWIFSEPIGVIEYVLGKFAGLLTAISTATLLGYGLASWIILTVLPPEDVSKYLIFILVAILLSASSLAIGFLLSVLSRSRFEALGIAFLSWFTMIFIYDLVVMGLTISLMIKDIATFYLTILNPVDSSRILMTYLIDPTLTFLGPTGAYMIREMGNTVVILVVSVLLLYTLSPLVITIKILRGSDIIK
jgi:ABC-type transport system involved in multi-copper enzyme maturation permease subunit